MRVGFSWAAGAALCAGLTAGGCTTSRSGGGPVAADDVAGRCAASVVGGAIVGTLVGFGAGGSRGAVAGALAGSAAGTVGCAVIAALDAQDRERIRSAQIAAAAANRPRYQSYTNASGQPRQVKVTPKPAPAAVAEGPLCRAIDTAVTVPGTGTADLPPQRVCRTPSGAWLPA